MKFVNICQYGKCLKWRKNWCCLWTFSASANLPCGLCFETCCRQLLHFHGCYLRFTHQLCWCNQPPNKGCKESEIENEKTSIQTSTISYWDTGRWNWDTIKVLYLIIITQHSHFIVFSTAVNVNTCCKKIDILLMRKLGKGVAAKFSFMIKRQRKCLMRRKKKNNYVGMRNIE